MHFVKPAIPVAPMAEVLRAIKGAFILSLNDRSEVRSIFSEFNIYGVETAYTVSGIDNSKKNERSPHLQPKIANFGGVKRGEKEDF